MGCNQGRENNSIEEEIIKKCEFSLNYNLKNCKDVDTSHRKFSYKGRINANQFKDITTKLCLAVSLHPTRKIIEFYNNFKVNQEDYSLNQLLLLGILLSSGSSMNKARLLFEIEDKINTNILKKANVQALVVEIL